MSTVFVRGHHRGERARRKKGEGTTGRRKKSGSGNLEKRHAHAILDARFGQMVVYAKKNTYWLFDPKKKCDACGASGRYPQQGGEDMLHAKGSKRGSFDAIAFAPGEPVLFVQWTSYGGASARIKRLTDGILGDLLVDPKLQAARSAADDDTLHAVSTARAVLEAGRGHTWHDSILEELARAVICNHEGMAFVPLEEQWKFVVWGWVRGEGMQEWAFNWATWAWDKAPQLIASPGLKREPSPQIELPAVREDG